jgi:Ca2+-binding EF-hand superfamily protein
MFVIVSTTQMQQVDDQFKELSKDGGITRNKFLTAFTGAGVGAEFAGILFDSFDIDGNKYDSCWFINHFLLTFAILGIS